MKWIIDSFTPVSCSFAFASANSRLASLVLHQLVGFFAVECITRSQALDIIWRHLLVVLLVSLILTIVPLFISEAGTGIAVFFAGNIGGYVSAHRSLKSLSDADVISMSQSWWPIIVPPFVGGILALLLYLIFLGNLLAGDIFPRFVSAPNPPKSIKSLLTQNAVGFAGYAKLLFWSFVAGFQQEYVVGIINSIQSKP